MLYYAIILDITGVEVTRLKYCISAKHAAYLASKFVEFCPPAQGFKIKKYVPQAATLAELFNDKEGH
jgi:hypothetical protein